jgi:hypothetical protein
MLQYMETANQPEAIATKAIRKWIYALLLSEFLFVLLVAWSIAVKGVLPAPLFYNHNDTFMDFFNTNFWAFSDGRYDDWGSIYPIFTFLVGKLFTNPDCAINISSAIDLRACATGDVGYLLIAYIIGAGGCAAIAMRHLRGKLHEYRMGFAVIVCVAVLFSLPGLFALERGNYILISFMCLALAVVFKDDWKSALCLAIAISLKQYLVIVCLAPLLKRRFDYLTITLLFVLVLNLLGMLFIDENHFHLIIENMLSFSSTATSYFEKMWYATSFSALVKVLENSPATVRFLPLPVIDIAKGVIYTTLWIAVAMTFTALALTIRLAAILSWEYISLVALTALVLLVDGVGGYSLILLVPYLIAVLGQDNGLNMGRLPMILPLVFILLTPLDIVIGPTARQIGGESFLSGRFVEFAPSLTLGSYIRPVAVFLLMYSHVSFLMKRYLSNKKSRFSPLAVN